MSEAYRGGDEGGAEFDFGIAEKQFETTVSGLALKAVGISGFSNQYETYAYTDINSVSQPRWAGEPNSS